MQCPRCGLQNQPGISACVRCGLPVYFPAPPGPYAPQPGPAGDRPPYPPQQPGQYGGSPGGPAYGGQPGTPGWPPAGAPGVTYPPSGASQPRPPAQGPQGSGSTEVGAAPGPYATPQPYGGHPAYAGPPPATGAAAWSDPAESRTATTSGRSARLAVPAALGLASLLSLVYAVWAFTARRGIFSDFASGTSVGVGRAKSNDRTDTILLIVAGVVALVALALWLMRKFAGETRGGLIDNLGLALAGLGALVVIVGLFLASQVSGGSDQAASGDRGVTASVVMGSGFLLLAIGLLLGLLAVRSRARSSSPTTAPGAPAGGNAGW